MSTSNQFGGVHSDGSRLNSATVEGVSGTAPNLYVGSSTFDLVEVTADRHTRKRKSGALLEDMKTTSVTYNIPITTGTNAMTTGALTCSSLNSSGGAANVGALNATNLISGSSGLSITSGASSLQSLTLAGTLSARAINAGTNAMTCGALSSGAISSGTSGVTCGQLDVTGTAYSQINCQNLRTTAAIFDGPITSTSSFTNYTSPMTTGNLTCTSLTSSGSISCGTNAMTCGALSSGPINNYLTDNVVDGITFLNSNSNQTSSRYIGIAGSNRNSIATNSGFSGIEFGSPAGSPDYGYVAIHCHKQNDSSSEKARFSWNGAVSIPGTITTRGVLTETNGGTPTELKYYEEYTHNTLFNAVGPYDIKITRTGRVITLHIPDLNGNYGATSVINAVNALPARFRPSSAVHAIARVFNNNALAAGLIIVGTSGAVQIYSDATGSGFTGTNSGSLGYSVSYSI